MLDVAIAMRHPAMRASLTLVLEGDPDLRPVGAASGFEAAVRLLRDAQPDAVLVDEDCRHRLPELLAAAPGAVFLVLGMGDHPAYGEQARRDGAAGYIRLEQAAERVPDAIRAALATRSSSAPARAA